MLNRFFKLCVICILSLSSTLWGKVYDCFLFFNEYDILDIRFHELYDHVDKFVIVESCEGFAGHPKPFRFEKAKERYAQFLDKVIYVKLHERQQTDNPWVREHWQRDQIMRGLVGCDPDDVIFISDCDEIFEWKIVKEVVEALKTQKLVLIKPFFWSEFVLNRPVYSPTYGCNTHPDYWLFSKDFSRIDELNKNPGIMNLPIWGTTVVLKYKDLVPYSPQTARNSRFLNDQFPGKLPYSVNFCKVSGWHFSYMGGYRSVRNKMENWSHTNDPGGNPGKGLDSFDHKGWWNAHKSGVPAAPVDDYYPKYVQDNIDYFMSIGLIDPWQ